MVSRAGRGGAGRGGPGWGGLGWGGGVRGVVTCGHDRGKVAMTGGEGKLAGCSSSVWRLQPL